MNNQTKLFLKDIKSHCKQHDTKIILQKTKHMFYEGICINGVFDSYSRTIKVAINKKHNDWLHILVHEYAHFTQHIEDAPVWKNGYYKGKDVNALAFEWEKDNKMEKRVATICISKSIDIELDCEKRALKLIKKYNLPIDRVKYIQQANAYLYAYTYLLNNKKWLRYTYENKALYKEMPKTFRVNHKKMSKKICKLYDRHSKGEI
jgi:hypothetical protein